LPEIEFPRGTIGETQLQAIVAYVPDSTNFRKHGSRALRFAPNPLGNPHPKLRLVAH
jgi:hypothetical protein